MRSEILFLVPTRGRPWNIIDLLGTYRDYGTEDSHLSFIVDSNDPELDRYNEIILPPRTSMRINISAVGIGHILNTESSIARLFSHINFSYIGFMGDDHRPRTKGFDSELAQAIDDLGGTGFAYPNDLLQGELIPTSCVMSTDIIETLGYMCPPALTHLCLDMFWLELGKGIDRIKYLDDVIVEHMHPAAGKAKLDPGYERVNSPEMMERDSIAWYDYLENGLAADIEKVKAIL